MKPAALFARSLRTLALFAMVALALTTAATAQSPSPDPQAALVTVFTSPHVDGSPFAASFLAQVPLTTVQAVLDDYRQRLGNVSMIRPTTYQPDYVITFARGTVLATVSLDASGKITLLRLHDETSESNRAAIVRLLSAGTPQAAWFAPSFLSSVPLTQVAAIVAQVDTQEGAFERLEVRDGAYFAVFAKFENHVLAKTDAQGRFTELLLRPPGPLGTSPH